MPVTIRVLVLLGCAALASCTGSSGELGDQAPVTTGAVETRFRDLEIVSNLPPPSNTNEGADQLIAENDLLEIDVFGVDELDRTARVDSRGRISLALIGAVEAKDKTVPELETEIEASYGKKYLQNPEVSVFVKESAGQRVTVDGVVMKPGIYPVTSTSTLLQIIAQAGGFQDIADETKLYVFRSFGDKKLVANYNVKEIRAGKNRDPRVFGGDVIVSFTSDAKVAARNLREALGIASSAVRLAPL
ncbi:MAG: polysaccharide biosynthesis/export family protein [Pseudomonadota bacterium]|nr:polysaccharide biosynthesis/export family protein [Pseudomonadota bacterium]